MKQVFWLVTHHEVLEKRKTTVTYIPQERLLLMEPHLKQQIFSSPLWIGLRVHIIYNQILIFQDILKGKVVEWTLLYIYLHPTLSFLHASWIGKKYTENYLKLCKNLLLHYWLFLSKKYIAEYFTSDYFNGFSADSVGIHFYKWINNPSVNDFSHI